MTITRSELISQMVAALRCVDVDLGDEREVILALGALRFRQGDVVACVDKVIEETRRQGLKRTWA